MRKVIFGHVTPPLLWMSTFAFTSLNVFFWGLWPQSLISFLHSPPLSLSDVFCGLRTVYICNIALIVTPSGMPRCHTAGRTQKLETGRLGFKSHFSEMRNHLAVWPVASYSTSLSPDLPLCEMGLSQSHQSLFSFIIKSFFLTLGWSLFPCSCPHQLKAWLTVFKSWWFQPREKYLQHKC